MARTDLFLKVVIDHDDRERPEKIAEELCRRLTKVYSVRSAELSNLITHRNDGENAEAN